MNRSTQNLGEHLAVHNQSEVARLMSQIEREYEMIVWARTGIAEGTAKHLYINRRSQAIGNHQQHLSQLVGKHQAASMVKVALKQTSTGAP